MASDPEWIAASERGAAVLVDRACIDLIQRKRKGQPVSADDYVGCFPELGQQAFLLDLIDADLCVSAELRQPNPQSVYSDRHPHLAAAIDELVRLDPVRNQDAFLPSAMEASPDRFIEEAVHSHPLSDPPARLEPACEDFSVDSGLITKRDLEVLQAPQHLAPIAGPVEGLDSQAIRPLAEQDLVETPSWFAPRQCVAVGPGHWLIRGRDEVRDAPLALKVVRLPAGVAADLSSQLLDVCEAASKVQNPAWVPPVLATIQNQHLGTIRPWWFARAMPREWPGSNSQAANPHTANANSDRATEAGALAGRANRSKRSLFEGLASIAFAIAAAHQAGATHGGVSATNILVDHDGDWKLVDAVSNRAGISRYVSSQYKVSDRLIASLETRQRLDIQDLIKTISNVLLSSEDQLAEKLIPAMRSRGNHLEVAADIGSILMDVADSKPIKWPEAPARKGFLRWLPRQT